MTQSISTGHMNKITESVSADVPAIALENVHLTLAGPAGPVNILRGIDLNVAHGTALGVVGPSGSGKTTMLMIIAGLERISSGRVKIAGTDYANKSEDQLALFRRDNVGIVFQSFHLIPTMTALENVAVPLELMGDKNAFARAAEASHSAQSAAGRRFVDEAFLARHGECFMKPAGQRIGLRCPERIDVITCVHAWSSLQTARI